jgi:hypothetical protein
MSATTTTTGEHPDIIRSWDIGPGGPIVEVVRTEQGPAIGLWASEHPDRRLSPEDAREVARVLLEAVAMVEVTS